MPHKTGFKHLVPYTWSVCHHGPFFREMSPLSQTEVTTHSLVPRSPASTLLFFLSYLRSSRKGNHKYLSSVTCSGHLGECVTDNSGQGQHAVCAQRHVRVTNSLTAPLSSPSLGLEAGGQQEKEGGWCRPQEGSSCPHPASAQG